MENHPIPQDITGFEFKLIGDMTIKQFAYLASGSVLAYITFSLPIFFLIKIPLTSLFIVFGISFAFLSIAGRPVDVMIINFIKATFSSTKYIYQQAPFGLPNVPAQQVQSHAGANLSIPVELPKAPQNKLDKKEFDFFKMLSQMLVPSHTAVQNNPAPSTHTVATHIISADSNEKRKIEEPKKEENTQEVQPQMEEQKMVEQTQALQEELQKAKIEEQKDVGTPSYESAHEKVLEIEKLLNDTVAQKQDLERELLALKKQLAQQNTKFFTPTETPNVRTLGEDSAKSAGIPDAPTYPNLISGIIKDPRGNPLPNILVEVKDKEGNPVRAFKTSGLGNFSASTPLVNGSYTIEFEDPKGENKFDAIQFEASGEIILPIEVISVDTREELRRTLFKN